MLWWTWQTSELEWSERGAVRKAIDTPQAVLLVRLRTIKNNVINSEGDGAELAVANVHVTWSQLKYPALQALQVRDGLSIGVTLLQCRTRFSSVVTIARPPVSSSLQITNRSFRYASPFLCNQLSLLRSVILILFTLFLIYLILRRHDTWLSVYRYRLVRSGPD